MPAYAKHFLIWAMNMGYIYCYVKLRGFPETMSIIEL